MPSTTNFGWTTPADTDLVKDGAAAIRTLGNGVDTSFVDLKGGTSGQILAKNSNTDLDFVWIANDQGDITAVTAGTGISGGGTSGAVTITNSMATEITASGDIIVGTGSGTFDNLPIGSTGQVLTADTTVSPYKVKWATPAASFKGALVYMANGVTQSLSNNTYTAINFATEQFDTDAFHDTVTNNNRLTIPAGLGGYYQIYANLRFDTNGTGIRRLDFEVNGGGNTYGVSIFTPNGAANSTVASTITLNLSAADWVGIQALQTSGGNLNVAGLSAIAGSFFGITYLGA